MPTDSGVAEGSRRGAQVPGTVHGLFAAQVDRAPDRIACAGSPCHVPPIP
jgi:hypothetical protein